ncbi:MAG: hypothetical protein QG670_2022 [Thermoproteota archaeon]|nr:hypothetical protein [Thermoproteota archaeon]
MKTPTRITIALDEETVDLFENAKKETGFSQSELIRKALRFYCENQAIIDDKIRKKLYTYMDMLLSSEHVILDMDHWLLFLALVESSPEKEAFWDNCKKVADSHAEQLKGKITSVEGLLERLETCNFFRINRETKERFTLVLYSEIQKKFTKLLLQEILDKMGFETEIKEDFTKLRVEIKKHSETSDYSFIRNRK